jgi:hypothetical protein
MLRTVAGIHLVGWTLWLLVRACPPPMMSPAMAPPVTAESGSSIMVPAYPPIGRARKLVVHSSQAWMVFAREVVVWFMMSVP